MAAFLGEQPHYSDTTVWYEHTPRPVSELDFRFDPENTCFVRLVKILKAARQRFGNEAVIAMTDLGGPFDILASFTASDKLVLELYDHPDQVHNAIGQLNELWFQAFGRLNEVLGDDKIGHSTWASVLSKGPYFIFQCDFAFMISPDLFRQFVLPDLEKSFAKMPRSIYHLDGQPQLNHLPMLLENRDLDCVEWVPGHGSPDVSNWPETYKQVQAAGKNNHIFDIQYEGDPLELPDIILEQTGSLKGFAFIINQPVSREAEAMEMLRKHGVI
jgi:hypothetical protein